MSYSFEMQSIAYILVLVLVGSSCGSKKEGKYRAEQAVETNTTNDNQSASESTEAAEINGHQGAERKTDDCGLKGSDPFKLPTISKDKGERPKVVASVVEAFIADKLVPEGKNNLENYDTELRQNADCFFVYFSPHYSPQDKSKPSEGGETSLGKAVIFYVSKKDGKIKRRYFFK